MAGTYDPEAMDAAALKAAQELRRDMTGEEVAQWFGKYTMEAGYKRLSRALLEFFEVKRARKSSNGED